MVMIIFNHDAASCPMYHNIVLKVLLRFFAEVPTAPTVQFANAISFVEAMDFRNGPLMFFVHTISQHL
jgi:quinolinate synthase